MIYWELLTGFLQVGLFSFGGAYGAIPLIRDVVLSRGWLDDAALSYMIAVSESTPGPIMVNMATYIGSSQGGFLGAAVATLAVVLPAFVIIIAVSALMTRLLQSPVFRGMMDALKACVAGIILATGLQMLLSCCTAPGSAEKPGVFVNGRALLILAVLAAAKLAAQRLWHKKLSPVTLILLSAVLGAAVYGV